MNVFVPILTQMPVLFAFIAIGFLLYRIKVIPENGTAVLSKLENTVFVPALVMSTFIANCTVENIGTLWRVLLVSLVLLVVLLPLSLLATRLICRNDDFLRKIALYGLEFSNFGFMGNAVVKGVFPEIFFEYTVFTLPFWFAIYAWGVPTLLIATSEQGDGKRLSRLKNFINPMLIAMLIGMVIGLSGLPLPTAATGAVNMLADCMSPIAMILTGATVAKSDIRALLKKPWLYLLSTVRLALFPLLYILVVALLPKGSLLTPTVLVCGLCMTAMPMGLNAIVVPAAYGKDTSQAAALTIVTHLLSMVTIPLLFLLFSTVVR